MNRCSPTAVIPAWRETLRSEVAATSSLSARRRTGTVIAALIDTIDAQGEGSYLPLRPLCPLYVGAVENDRAPARPASRPGPGACPNHHPRAFARGATEAV